MQSHALDPLWILTLDLSRSHSGFPLILHWTPPDPNLDPPKDPPKIPLWIPLDLTLDNPGSKPSCPSTRTAITSVGAQLHSRSSGYRVQGSGQEAQGIGYRVQGIGQYSPILVRRSIINLISTWYRNTLSPIEDLVPRRGPPG
jgi:hypothetical protein